MAESKTPNAAVDKQTILIALDIEKTGSFLIKNPIISVGFFIGDTDGKCLSTHKFNIEVRFPTMESSLDAETKQINNTITDYGDFEPRCWDEFWSALSPEIMNRCLSNPTPLPAEKAWQSIAKFINDLEDLYPADKYKIKFLTDNASFDVASVDYALEKYTCRPPMRYSSKGKYRSVISADDMLDMLTEEEQKLALAYIDSQVKHDHDSVNDAHHIYLQYIQAMKYKK